MNLVDFVYFRVEHNLLVYSELCACNKGIKFNKIISAAIFMLVNCIACRTDVQMDKCLEWPALTEGDSSERPIMRVNKLVHIEQIYKVTPICTIKDVERMSRDTQAPETDSNMQKSCEEPSNKGKCKNDRRLSGDMKVQKSQDLSQSNIAKRVPETDEGKNKNDAGATALKRTSTKNQRPASSFPHRKPEEHPAAGKTCHSSKATTKEVKCKNHLTQNEVANGSKNEEHCFRRLRKSISSEKTKPSENQIDVEGGNQAACDLQDSENSLSENVEVSETDEEKNKNEVGATALKITSTKNKRPASSFPHQKPEEHPTEGKICHSSKATTKEVKCKNHLTQNEAANEIKNEERCFQRLRESISSGKTKPSENQVDVEGGNQAACDLQDSENSLYTMRDGKFSSQLCKKRSSWRSDIQSGKFPKYMTPNIPLSGYHEEAREQEFRFSSSGAEHKNCWKNVSLNQDIASMEVGAEIIRCPEDNRKSSRVADKEKSRSQDEMVSVKQKKMRLGEEGNLRLRNKRVPPWDDDQNPRFSLLEVSHKTKDVKVTRHVSKSTTTENNNGEISDSLLAVGKHGSFFIKGVDNVAMAELEAHNWKSSPSLFISQPASSNSLLQIRGRTSLTASHTDVSRDQLHHEYHWPLSAISPNSTSAAMLEKFELQKIEGRVSKAFCSNPQESQVFARHNTTVSGDKGQLSLMAKNSIHDNSQAKSHAASTSRLRLLGKDIILEDTNMTTANTHGYSHNITTHNMFGHESSDGISIPTISVAGPRKSLSISRLNDGMAMLPPPLVHNDSGSSHRPVPHETVLLNNNYHGAIGHPPPELAAAYLNNFSQSAFPTVPDDHWRHVNPSYFHHQAGQQGMTAFTSYVPPNGQAIRSNDDPRPLIFSSPAARTSFVPSSSSAPSSSKHARRRRN